MTEPSSPRSQIAKLRNTHGFTRFVAVVVALIGLATIVGVAMTVVSAGSYRVGIAAAMWLIGFFAVLYVPGQLVGEIWTWGLDEESERVKTHWARPSWSVLPAGVVVMAIGTIVYIL